MPAPRSVTPNLTIQVTLKLFSVYQDVYGQPEQMVECPIGTTVRTLYDRHLAQHPSLARWRSVTRFGVNLDFVPPETVLRDGDEVVFIPPVSGGAA